MKSVPQQGSLSDEFVTHHSVIVLLRDAAQKQNFWDHYFKQQKNSEFLLKIQVRTKYRFLKKLFLYFQPSRLVLLKQQGHQQLKEMIQQ